MKFKFPDWIVDLVAGGRIDELHVALVALEEANTEFVKEIRRLQVSREDLRNMYATANDQLSEAQAATSRAKVAALDAKIDTRRQAERADTLSAALAKTERELFRYKTTFQGVHDCLTLVTLNIRKDATPAAGGKLKLGGRNRAV